MGENGKRHSNLESFLACVTPSVSTYSLPKACFRDTSSLWESEGKELIECFNLEDLWELYAECSAYGLGVPIVLNNGETAVQYFTPSLSAVQIYTNKSPTLSRYGPEESETDSWSDDSTSERLSRSWDAVSDDSAYDLDSSLPPRERHLYFEFSEHLPPYSRVPFMGKVHELARDHPGLTTFKSVELSPASWMSIAWYPIYAIPGHGNSKDLDTCFLTYHNLSSILQDDAGCVAKGSTSRGGLAYLGGSEMNRNKRITLSPFGLATYKMQGDIWRNPGTSDAQRITALRNAADSWLTQLGAVHPDFNFFRNNFRFH
ncbi:uncharacterized protein LOC109727038 isoform X1 [Ananas comosus]|uniref:Uncharacterized protein LOC109727038 isoform X1 n=1 Tax=Ananas comosus TaxID=4615 RepID=A0A6P5H311_ANACO|nr:uncharacterized protein LOC109727038 isoform X1 [Ananas comosus]